MQPNALKAGDVSIRILIINDDPGEMKTIEAWLDQDMRVPWSLACCSSIEASAAFVEGVDIIIFKPDGSEEDKPETFARLNGMVFETPIIVLANSAEREHGMSTRLMECGAADMVQRGQFARLVDAIEFALIRQKISTRTRKSSERVRAKDRAQGSADLQASDDERDDAAERHKQILRMLIGAYTVDQTH